MTKVTKHNGKGSKKGKGTAHKIKRPTIMLDLEFALLCMIGKSVSDVIQSRNHL